MTQGQWASILEDIFSFERDPGLGRILFLLLLAIIAIVVVAWCEYNESKNNKKAKWLYRLESKSKDNGLWYDSRNSLVWGIGAIPGCETKYLPMGWDERYHKDGRNWFSSCSRKEDLAHWYSLKDAELLIANGFVFTKYLAVDYVEYDLETTFLKETALKRVELDIHDIWQSELE